MDADLLSHWTADPSLLLGLAALAAVWWRAAGLTPPPPLQVSALERGSEPLPLSSADTWRGGGGVRPAIPLTYAAGLFVLFIALVSPLDYLADHVLFSAHMLQHLLLLLVAPPLLLVGLPDGGIDLARQTVAGMGPAVSWIARPLWALVISTGVVWAWHVPTFYDAALASEPLHALEHLSFLATATLYWWPVARPEAHPFPLADLFQFPYLLAAIVASSLLAAVITFAPVVLYPTYAAPAFAAARASLGLDPLTDQVVGGLSMWVGGGLWYLLAAGVVLARWFSRPDDTGGPVDGAPAEEQGGVRIQTRGGSDVTDFNPAVGDGPRTNSRSPGERVGVRGGGARGNPPPHPDPLPRRAGTRLRLSNHIPNVRRTRAGSPGTEVP